MWIYLAALPTLRQRVASVLFTVSINGFVAARSNNMAANMGIACLISFSLNASVMQQVWAQDGYNSEAFLASCAVNAVSASCLMYWQNLRAEWYWFFHSSWHILGSVGIQLTLLSLSHYGSVESVDS
jgi:hypothetical protein